MSRFRLYANAAGAGYLLDVQANLLGHFNTRVVVPLLPVDAAPKPAKVLNPIFEIAGTAHVMVTQYMAAMPVRELGAETLDLRDRAHEIVGALDCVFQGV